MSIARVLVAFIALCASASTSFANTDASHVILRGFDPAQASALRDATTFTCDSNTRTIAITSVNDDYCDCDDGTDEPGTSACAGAGEAATTKGMYCVNRGSTPTRVPSSRVNDGVCDCCDGSDEYDAAQNGGVVCENTCTKAAKARRAELVNALSAARRGVKAKAKASRYAKDDRRAMETELKDLQKQMDEAQSALEVLRAPKEQEEALEREMREKERLLEEKRAEETKSTEEEEKEKEANTDGDARDDDGAREGARENDAMEDAAEETAEERGKRIAGQWISDESESTRVDDEDDDYDEHEDEDHVVVDDPMPADGTKTSKCSALFARAKRALQRARLAKKDADAGAALTSPAFPTTHRDAFDKQQRAVDALQTQIDQVRASVNRNYGPDDVLISLRQQCYEVKIEKYAYKACPFGEAHQDSVRLGTNTDGVEISPLTGDMMLKFTNGATCWNGPNRSLSLTLKCGDREALADVEEPSRCEYSATLFTPQACDESAVAELDAELSTLDRIIAGAGRDEL